MFATFLEYKGIKLYYKDANQEQLFSVEDKKGEFSKSETTFALKASKEFPDNQCVPFATIQCFQADAPYKGDLIVILSGVAYPDKINELKANSKLLFSYQQQPNLSIAEKMLFLFSQPSNRLLGKTAFNKTMNDYFVLRDVYLFQKT